MTEKTNVVNFPNMKEIKDDDIDFASEYAKAILSSLLDTLHRMGYDIKENEEDLLPMSMFVFEAIKAFHMKGTGTYHPIHDMADELFKELED